MHTKTHYFYIILLNFFVRDGMFPATSCLKVKGVDTNTEEQVIARSCALDSGSGTTDTEIVRMSHCGTFYLDTR